MQLNKYLGIFIIRLIIISWLIMLILFFNNLNLIIVVPAQNNYFKLIIR